MDWQAIGAGAAVVAVVGGFLGWVVRMSIKAAFADFARDYATKDYVDEKMKTHVQIHHKGK